MFGIARQFLYITFRPVTLPLGRHISTSVCIRSDIRTIDFVTANGNYLAKGKVGDSLLDVVVDNDLPLDGFGACEGTLACCTCHVILKKEHFDRVDRVNPTSEEELDLLDLAPALTDESRLGCQIKIDKGDPEILTIQVPEVTRDARALD